MSDNNGLNPSELFSKYLMAVVSAVDNNKRLIVPTEKEKYYATRIAEEFCDSIPVIITREEKDRENEGETVID